MSCLYNISNIFSNTFFSSYFILDEEEIDDIILVKFSEDVEFLVSQDGLGFRFIPSRTIEKIKNKYFDNDKPNSELFLQLSEISEIRGSYHPPEYFHDKLKKVYFHYVNKEIVPYRYSLRKLK